MKTITTSVLGVDVPITDVPETLEEMVAAAGGEDKAVQVFVNHIKFHKSNGEAREAVCEALEKATGIKIKTEQRKSPTKADPNRMIEAEVETEQEYANRVYAESGQSAEQLAASGAFSDITVKFDAQGTREPGAGRKLAKAYTEGATKLLAGGEPAWSKAVGILESSNPGLTVERDADGKPTVESLASAIKRNKERVEAEANNLLGLPA